MLKTFGLLTTSTCDPSLFLQYLKLFMRRSLMLLLLYLTICVSWSQTGGKMTRMQYFEKFHILAVEEMHRSGIPASITLAQGVLESGDGNSRLAREANNHFGIKCHNDWNGKKIYQDDDERNECFRKYPSVEDSYHDHTNYLKSKSRYAFLFELELTDYKGWARGLKKAGYATSPTYADRLIKIIEDYDLFRYDDRVIPQKTERRKARHTKEKLAMREVLETNRVKFVRATKGDTYAKITAELGKLDWEIPKYNEASMGDSIVEGQVVYIQPKRNRAQVSDKEHVFKTGETMRMVSQLYAIKLESLYKMNNLKPGTQPEPGTKLQLRKALKTGVAKQPELKEKVPDSNEEEGIKIDLNLE
jgi:LysM repeat protein